VYELFSGSIKNTSSNILKQHRGEKLNWIVMTCASFSFCVLFELFLVPSQ